MQPDARALLWDAHRAAELIRDFAAGRTWDDYRAIDLRRIVAFRNVLVHGYATIDDAIVWEVATERLGDLTATLARLLEDNG